MPVLQYGNGRSVQLDFAKESAAAVVEVPRGEALDDLKATALEALHAPMDYPPLAQCITPADRITLALEHGVPRAAELVAAAVETMIDAGVEPESITVLQSQADHDAEAADPRLAMPPALQKRIALLTHNPDDRRELAYLAADKAGEAILVNRALHEADFILPIGCLRDAQAPGYFGIHGAVYPTFSDTKTQQRFRGPGALHNHCNCHQRHSEHGHAHHHAASRGDLAADVGHVAWLLGLMFTVQVVPGAGGRALHVLAGQSDSVRRHGEALYHAAWAAPVQRRADLVVAAIEGGPDQQTWENVGRALSMAGRFCEEDGAIAICSDLSALPGAAMQHLIGATTHASALRHIGKDRPADALAAAQLVQSLDGHKVYLLSRLDSAVVEELEMIPVEKPDELARLAKQHDSCLLLPSAPYVVAEKRD